MCTTENSNKCQIIKLTIKYTSLKIQVLKGGYGGDKSIIQTSVLISGQYTNPATAGFTASLFAPSISNFTGGQCPAHSSSCALLTFLQCSYNHIIHIISLSLFFVCSNLHHLECKLHEGQDLHQFHWVFNLQKLRHRGFPTITYAINEWIPFFFRLFVTWIKAA